MKPAAFLIALAMVASPAQAGNSLIAAGTRVAVAKSALTVAPPSEWNKLGARPGRNSETWTIDGDALNDLTFYGGIPAGKTLFREVDKKNRPLPRVSATMLITDVPVLVENSYRIALNTPLFTLDAMEPALFAGRAGLRFTYSYTRPGEDLPRKGEGRTAIIDGKLYMMTFEAPRLHYFDRSVDQFRKVADTARL
ncbi:hypothetical protein [Sphingomonas sp.]|jgi:hypothetical protein|uniref:hypothetical protein n=1 Tax=Sphingomonas sp. TaxID=28214 RepID=UPI002ED7F27D